MTFQYSDQYRTEYATDGFTVLRGLIPPTLLSDLRAETDKAREIARRTGGPQAQRLQPVYAYDEIDPQPFRDFLALPGLRDTVEGILGPDHRQSDIMGVLLEPEENAWCTPWHRDWGYNAPHVKLDEFFKSVANLGMHNQLNGALYDDHSLWVAPGSHNREDLPQERAAFPAIPPPGPVLNEEMNPTEREHTCLAYARQMPGAVPVSLFGRCRFLSRLSVAHRQLHPLHPPRHSTRRLLRPGRPGLARNGARLAGGSAREDEGVRV